MKESRDTGVANFNVLLARIDDGGLHDQASDEYTELNAALADHVSATGGKASGTLTITVKFTHDKKGVVTVSGTVASKKPKQPTGESIFWVTPGGKLSPKNPRQAELPLREIEGGLSSPARDLSAVGGE